MEYARIWRREECIQRSIPIISKATEEFLIQWIQNNHPQNILEIWTAIGYSASCISTALSEYTFLWVLHSREISYPHYRQSIENTLPYNGTTIFQGNICTVPFQRYVPATLYDMIFIDWRKSETLTYITILQPYMDDTGTIIVDDSIKFKEKMKDCYEFLDKRHIAYESHYIDEDDGVLTIPITPLLLQALSSQWHQ